MVEARSISLSHLQGGQFQFSASYDDALADIHSYDKSWERPDLQVLVDARVRDLGLCRTLLSTVVQGYPAPILVGYHNEPLHGDTLDLFRSIIKSIVKPPTAEGDIVLWVGRHHWVQLPVEVTVRRFLQHADIIVSTAQRRRHGKSKGASDVRGLGGGNDTGLGLIFLPASKACIYDCQNADMLPESTLPNDLYGPLTDRVPCPGLKRPRFAAPGAFIGTARDVIDSLTDIIDHMTANTSTQLDEESAWSHLLYQQELHRSIEQQDTPAGGWMYQTLGALSRNHAVTKSQSREDNNVSSTPSRAQDEPNHAYGLALDYASRIFQTLLHSDQDIRFLTFSQPHLVRSPSRTAANFFAPPAPPTPRARTRLSPPAPREYVLALRAPGDQHRRATLLRAGRARPEQDAAPAGPLVAADVVLPVCEEACREVFASGQGGDREAGGGRGPGVVELARRRGRVLDRSRGVGWLGTGLWWERV